MDNYLSKLSGDLRLIKMGTHIALLLQKRSTSSRCIAKKIGIPYRSFRNYMNDTRTMPLRIAFQVIRSLSKNKQDELILINELFKKISWIKSIASTSQPVMLPKSMSKELAYLLGAIHDGTVFANNSKNQYVIQYWQFTDVHWLNIISKKLEKVFSCKPKKYANYVQLSSKAAYQFFANVLCIPQQQGKWNSFLKGIPKNLRVYAIAGFFDAEGWIGTLKDLRLKFSQNNQYKLAELKLVMKDDFHIDSGQIIPENNGYALWLCGKNCIDFAVKIGCFCEHRSKRQKLTNLITRNHGQNL